MSVERLLGKSGQRSLWMAGGLAALSWAVLAGTSTVPPSFAAFSGIVDPIVDFFTSKVVFWAAATGGTIAAIAFMFMLRQGGLGQGGSKFLTFSLGAILAGSILTVIAGYGVQGAMIP